ncbi:MAG: SIMPL domain-containing protein [Candidatus Omnitrophica bacterium]|nr:SIMPL domain-containing protein [Candidatus Omnitrophota bacterium]
MSGITGLKNVQIIVLGLCIAAGTIFSTFILSKGLMQMKKFSSEVIDVTGSAENKIVSDYIVWKARFSRRDTQLPQAYNSLKEDLKKVKSYLIAKGIKEEEIIVSQVSTATLYKKNDKGNDTNDIEAYILSQAVEVRSAQVSLVDEVSRQSTELINSDIAFISEAPEYFYTKLAQLKLEMLAKATENAKARAENMAQATGNKIGLMRSARMGVFQITPANSTEVSDWGVNDTTSLEKKVTAVVWVSFAIA